LCSYLDQGIAIWNFPVWHHDFLASVREMEKTSYTSFFRTERAKKLLLDGTCTISDLLKILVGDESLYEQYLFDQQFAHQGWSGMVAAVETQPETLLNTKKISLHDLVLFELLLEIDALDFQFRKKWNPLCKSITEPPVDLFHNIPNTEINEVFTLWQEAFEWTYYDEVLAGLKQATHIPHKTSTGPKTFQAMFCIDDRECSLRRYLEKVDTQCETFATPGFFNVEFYFKPEGGKFYTKLCPAPVTPKHLIREEGANGKRGTDLHFTKHSHNFYSGWLISQTLGFWSAFKLFFNIFRPSMSPATASSFKHMDKYSRLTVENKNPDHRENDLQVGFTVEEMAQRVEGLLKSVGLVNNFAPIVYIVGHGSSSVNNPHYAAYDCGACSGRAGSVNARAFCYMANHTGVRTLLADKGILIPKETQFVGGIHDTARDEVMFFDENSLYPANLDKHIQNERIFTHALDENAKERSRRLETVNTKLGPVAVHKKMLRRSVSLFEPRPELNHATNTLCIVGRRQLTKNLFLDRRAFMNSYDYSIDKDGKLLVGIMKPLGPVCGGINLEYFFSRVDNQKLGAGTKLPHNVMGLFGVANGTDGDLRPGLPSQMIEVHDPIRLLIIVEHFPEVVLKTIQATPEMYEWFINAWVHLAAIHPETNEIFVFNEGKFSPYTPQLNKVETIDNIMPMAETHQENLPVYIIQ